MNEINTNIYGNGKGIIYANGKYYMLSYSPAKVCVSEDLENWTEYNLNSNYIKPKDIICANGVFVISGDNGNTGSVGNTYIYTSNDGITWTARKLETYNFSTNVYGLTFINNRIILMMNYAGVDSHLTPVNMNYFYESKDGISWKRHQLSTNSNVTCAKSIAYNPKKKLYVRGGDKGSIYTSNNLNNWIKRKSGVTTNLNSIVYAKNKYIAVGNNGVILVSTDGISWSNRSREQKSFLASVVSSAISTLQPSSLNNLLNIYYANGTYNIMGYNGTILQSMDGVSWKNISNINGTIFYGAVYYNDKFVYVGNYNQDHNISIYYYNISKKII